MSQAKHTHSPIAFYEIILNYFSKLSPSLILTCTDGKEFVGDEDQKGFLTKIKNAIFG